MSNETKTLYLERRYKSGELKGDYMDIITIQIWKDGRLHLISYGNVNEYLFSKEETKSILTFLKQNS